MKGTNPPKVVITFFLNGALVGVLFAWLVSVPSTLDFWFIRGNRFLIAKPNYWLVFGVLLTSGLAFSYCICVLMKCFITDGRWAESRRLLAIMILLIAFPFGHIVDTHLLGLVDPAFAYFLVCLIIVSLISVSLWLFTWSWRTWLAVFMLFAIPVSYLLTVVLYRSLDLSNFAYDILRMVFIGGLLSGIAGYWLATPRVVRRKFKSFDAPLGVQAENKD